MNDIDIRKVGRAGRITLNRPGALNAVTLPMIRRVVDVLPKWARDDEVDLIVIDAAGDRAFCAGADLSAAADGKIQEGFKRYARLLTRISSYPKPVVARINGASLHRFHRDTILDRADIYTQVAADAFIVDHFEAALAIYHVSYCLM